MRESGSKLVGRGKAETQWIRGQRGSWEREERGRERRERD